MNIIVCIKQVPDPEHFDKISVNKETNAITRVGIPAVINPLDKHALEEGLRMREKFGGKVTTICMGPPQADKALQESLAMGADEGVLLCDVLFAGADTWATAYCLSKGIEKLGDVDVILCGNQTVDGATGQVAPQLAHFLKLPHATFAEKIDFEEDVYTAKVQQQLEYGFMKIEIKLPAVIAVVKGINQYRLPGIQGIMESVNKTVHKWDAEEINADKKLLGLEGSPTRIYDITEQRISRRREIVEGKPEEAAREAIKKLISYGAI